MLSLKLSRAEPGPPGMRIKVTLVNTGNEAVVVNTRLAVSRPQRGGELFLAVTDSEGRQVPFASRVNIGVPDASRFEALQPGDSVERVLDLATYLPLRNRSGTLRVVATYANTHSAPEGRSAWQGEVESAPLFIAQPPRIRE